MPTEQVYSILDQAVSLGFQGRTLFHGMSEPCLDPRLPDFVEYAAERGLRVRLTSNGDKLRKDDELVRRLDGKVEVFKLSLYDYTTYKEKQDDIRFWNSRITKSRIRFACTREHVMVRFSSNLYPEEDVTEANNPAANLPCNKTRSLLIRYDGNVMLCCYDDLCSFGLGNAFEKSIEEIWWSDHRMHIARTLRSPRGRREFPYCAKCFYQAGDQELLKVKVARRVKAGLFRLGLVSIPAGEPLQ